MSDGGKMHLGKWFVSKGGDLSAVLFIQCI